MLFVFALFFVFSSLSLAQQNHAMQVVHSRTPGIVKQLSLKSISRMDPTVRLNLVFCLPLRNQQALTTLLHDLYDPTSPRYHQFLSHSEFISEFSPTETDYQSVISFAKANGLLVTNTVPDRMLIDVNGSVPDIQKALNVNMVIYKHPTENREFYSSDVEPSVNLSVPVLAIRGLDNYEIPRPADLKVNPTQTAVLPAVGSGPNGTYIGNDFRTAYVPSVSLNGHGQAVGLLEFNSGFYQSDITAYEQLAGLPNVHISSVLLDGCSGTPDQNDIEVSIDIEMAISMAPNLDSVTVYEGEFSTDILEAMASNTSIKQFSASWAFWEDYSSDPQWFATLSAQGQSFFNASGDWGAWGSYYGSAIDDPNVTIVGGTVLSTTAPGGAWSSETAWIASGGGISSNGIGLPSYQQGIANSANGASNTYRNGPDVAMNATNVWDIYNNGSAEAVQGTSVSSPLWAGFMALANQQAVSLGDGPLGCINYAIYPLGEGNAYTSAFHDITTGNNNKYGNFGYNAVSGYDLVTGWGSPKGQTLINFLSNPVWGGTKLLSSSYTVPSGQSLIIEPGANLKFASGASLVVNGMLEAVGTSSQPIAFTSTGSTSPGSWGSIQLNGSAANSSTISFANIQYGTEVDVNTANNVTIQNCNITNNLLNGINVTSSSNFTAQYNTIKNTNAYHGIIITGGSNNNCYYNVISKTNHGHNGAGILYSGSSGTVGENDIDYYNWGIAGIWGASPSADLDQAGIKNNRVTNCLIGLYMYHLSYGEFGVSTSYPSWGLNSIYNNSSYNALVGDGSTASGLYAECDWWGSYPPNSSLWYVYSGCYGYFTYPLTADPWAGYPTPSIKQIENSLEVTPRIAQNNSHSSPMNSIQNPVAVQSNLPDSLLIGVALRDQNNFTAAKDFFLSYLNSHPDNQAAYVYLYSCADSATTPAIIQYFTNLPKQAAPDHKLLLANLYLMQGNVTSAKQVNNAIIAANPNTPLAVRAELNNLSIALYSENDVSTASAILTQVESQASLTTPMELSTAEAAFKYYVNPQTGQMSNSSAGQSGSSTDVVQSNDTGSLQNYPNPFNPTTTISYQIQNSGHVTIKVFDVLGRDVTTLVDEFKPAGRYTAQFDASRLASGIYFYSIKSSNYNAVKKMLLLK